MEYVRFHPSCGAGFVGSFVPCVLKFTDLDLRTNLRVQVPYGKTQFYSSRSRIAWMFSIQCLQALCDPAPARTRSRRCRKVLSHFGQSTPKYSRWFHFETALIISTVQHQLRDVRSSYTCTCDKRSFHSAEPLSADPLNESHIPKTTFDGEPNGAPMEGRTRRVRLQPGAL